MRKLTEGIRLGLAFLLAASPLLAASQIASNTETAEVSVAQRPAAKTLETLQRPSESKVYGLFEIRPSWTSKQGEMHTEDTAELGYQISKDTRLTYIQWFNSNLFSPPGAGPTEGLGLFANDGLFRLKVSDIWKDGGTSLSYQARAYLPTYSPRREAGMLTIVKNYLKIAQKVSNLVSVDASFAPTFFVYDRAGAVVGGKPGANPWYENLLVFNADFHLTQRLTFSMPLVIQHTRYRAYGADPTHSDQWGYNFWIWPEVDYEINANHTVGISYYSDNLVKTDLSGTTIHSGLELGITQLIWTVTL